MRLLKHHSLVVADHILRHLRVLLKDERGKLGETLTLDVKCYANCREQGYHISHYLHETRENRAVSFSEHRNSDDIRVWYGEALHFNGSGIPGERGVPASFVQDRLFPPHRARSAALFIKRYLLTGETNAR